MEQKDKKEGKIKYQTVGSGKYECTKTLDEC